MRGAFYTLLAVFQAWACGQMIQANRLDYAAMTALLCLVAIADMHAAEVRGR